MVMRIFFLVSGMLLSNTLIAGDMYRWVDKNGQVHFSDRPPEKAVERVVRHNIEPGRPDDIATFEVLDRTNGWDVYATNRVQGPIEVSVSFKQSRSLSTEPRFPLRTVMKAGERVKLAKIDAIARDANFSLEMQSVPGDPQALSDKRLYDFPFRQSVKWKISQAFHGGLTHQDEQNRYAVDISVPIGSAVLAARGGVVMQTIGGFERTGTQSKKFSERANIIRVLHEDNTMGLYAHLKPGGIMVREGQRIQSGQLIGYSGNTGYSTGPHLHFCLQINKGMRLVSIPFRMNSPDGELKLSRK